jgi:hypothetical protein
MRVSIRRTRRLEPMASTAPTMLAMGTTTAASTRTVIKPSKIEFSTQKRFSLGLTDTSLSSSTWLAIR